MCSHRRHRTKAQVLLDRLMLLVRPLHEAVHLFEGLLVHCQEHVQINAFRLPSQAHATVDELLHAYRTTLVHIQEIEEHVRLRETEVQRLEDRSDLRGLQMGPKFLPTQGAGLVQVGLLEKGPDPFGIDLPLSQLILDQCLLVPSGNLGCRGNEGANDDVEDSEVHAENEEDKDWPIEHMHVCQRPHRIAPIESAGDHHEQSEHCLVEVSIQFQHVLCEPVALRGCRGRFLDKVLGRHTHK
mmetsp:Transcript_137789/g.357967  ORF Transcript_137789/g.357967 Transcript_137789/m.357967 type:complete len:241 (-) Transcript_137789:24-746(-)